MYAVMWKLWEFCISLPKRQLCILVRFYQALFLTATHSPAILLCLRVQDVQVFHVLCTEVLVDRDRGYVLAHNVEYDVIFLLAE